MSKMKSLINLHESTNLRVEDAIESSFPSPGEQKLFHDALQFRMANLPMFPEAGETAMNQMVREINQRFGRALRNVSTRKQSSSYTLPPIVIHPLSAVDGRSPSGSHAGFSSPPRDQSALPHSPQSTTTYYSQMHSSQSQLDNGMQRAMPLMNPIAMSPMTYYQGHVNTHGSQVSPTNPSEAPLQAAQNSSSSPVRVAANQSSPTGFLNQAMSQHQLDRTMQNQQVPILGRLEESHDDSLHVAPHQQVQSKVRYGEARDNLQAKSLEAQPQVRQAESQTNSVPSHQQQQMKWTAPQLLSQPNIPRQLTQNDINRQSAVPGRLPNGQGTSKVVKHKTQGIMESQSQYLPFVETPQIHRMIPGQRTPRENYQYQPPQLAAKAIPKIDIDWNIPVMAEEMTIEAFVDNSPKKQVNIREKTIRRERVSSSTNNPSSPLSVASDPTAVMSNRGRLTDSFDSTENMNENDRKVEKKSKQKTRTRNSNPIGVAATAFFAACAESPNKSSTSPLIVDSIQVKAIEGNYKLDISRNKSVLLFNEAETLQKHAILRKTLMDEVDRVNQRLATATMEGEKNAYLAYLDELQLELEKWNKAAHFGSDNMNVVACSNEQLKDLRASPVDEVQDSTGYSFETDKFTIETMEPCDLYKGDKRNTDDSTKTRVHSKKANLQEAKHDDGIPSDIRRQWRIVDIEAPNTLPGGFKFEARLDDEVFIATVPRGGVKKGEIFATRMGDIYGSNEDAADRTRVYKDMDAPPTRWRDDLFDCFRHGLHHPMLCNTIFCPMIALHQILSRVQMDGTGYRIVTIKSRTRVLFVVWLVFLLILIHVIYVAFFIVGSPDEESILIATIPLIGMDCFLLLYGVYMVAMTRRQVRSEYDIPELRCKGYEDCCMAVFCTCCTIAQMGRHTADYETYRAYCCSDTGLANHIEIKLPVESLLDRSDIERVSSS